MSNQKGFSKVFIVILGVIGFVAGLPILLLIIFAVVNAAKLSSQRHQIKDQVQGLALVVSPQSEQCGGDGIDSNAWCEYKYDLSIAVVEQALKNKGYTENSSTGYGESKVSTFIGGNPTLSFRVGSYGRLTNLYGERSQPND